MIPFLFVSLLFALNVIAKPVENSQCGISPNVKTYDGTDNTKILGGKVSNITDWPFVVKISDGLSYCTATIIGKQWILSAAHCNEDNSSLSVIIDGQTYENGQTYLHEEYDPNNNYKNDIMLYKLSEPIKFSKTVTNICLQRNVNAKNGDMAALAGFGILFDGVKNMNSTHLNNGIPINNINFKSNSLLHEVPVMIRDMDFCFGSVPDSTKICAGGEMQGVTQGDSGGPLAVVRDNRWVQYGVTSTVLFSGVSGNVDSVRDHGTFTRISSYCDWINKTTNGDVKCQ